MGMIFLIKGMHCSAEFAAFHDDLYPNEIASCYSGADRPLFFAQWLATKNGFGNAAHAGYQNHGNT
jgi:hypothetical protein